MNAEFFEAIEDIEKEKGIPRGYMYDKIKQAMLEVVQNGTGMAAQVRGARVAGKTGTAEAGGHVNSSFIGFAPYDSPTLAISVYLEGTDSDSVSGMAAQLAGQVLSKSLNAQASGSEQ